MSSNSPAQTQACIRALCRAYLDLTLWAQAEHEPVADRHEDVATCFAMLEAKIAGLYRKLDIAHRREMTPELARTRSDLLFALIKETGSEAIHEVSNADFVEIIERGPEALEACLEVGMRPELSNFLDSMHLLMSRLSEENGARWYAAARTVFLYHPTILLREVFRLAESAELSVPLSVFLADLVKEGVQLRAARAEEQLLNACLTNSPFCAGGLLIAGARPLSQDLLSRDIGMSHEIMELCRKAASSHGRLTLQARADRLPDYLRGEMSLD